MQETDQAEHSMISTSLEVEQIDLNLFRSVKLFVPVRARGVFGGQVISQAIVSATNCVDPAFGLHCYFLLSASPAVPIIYYVERLRDGRSYSTRSVKAVQNGKIIFHLLCSFHVPEPWQPLHQWPMPSGVPNLEDCELEEDLFRRVAARDGLNEKMKEIYLNYATERATGPTAVRRAARTESDEHGSLTSMWWMQARTGKSEAYEAPYQKCILAYMSDLNFITVAAETLKLVRYSKGPDALAMSSTLDHSIWYYDDEFRCEDGLLYVVVCPRAGDGRGAVHGRFSSSRPTSPPSLPPPGLLKNPSAALAVGCLSLSPTCLPPRAIYSACLATGVQWFDWIALLGGSEFDFFVDPGCISVRFGNGSQLVTVWSEELPSDAVSPILPPNLNSQSKTIAQRLLESESADDDEIFAMIADEVSAPTWTTPVIDHFPPPTRSESPLSAVSSDSRSSSRSSNSSSCFSYASTARTDSSPSSSGRSSSGKLSRRDKARQARVFVDTSKTEVTPYDGGKTTVLTGGVMLGAAPSKAKSPVSSWRRV
ncbi:hypothetical protein JVU11DRAFT_5382 [Chiua virens]|nr:hypothetical protein JVU11DRAFT_5382 [Chiua virens]